MIKDKNDELFAAMDKNHDLRTELLGMKFKNIFSSNKTPEIKQAAQQEITNAKEDKSNNVTPKRRKEDKANYENRAKLNRQKSTEEYNKSQRKILREQNKNQEKELPTKSVIGIRKGLMNTSPHKEYIMNSVKPYYDIHLNKRDIIQSNLENPTFTTSDGKIHVKKSFLTAKKIVDRLNSYGKDRDIPKIEYTPVDMDAINKHNADIDAKNKVVTQSAEDYIDDLLDTLYEAYYYDLLTDNDYEAFVESVYEADNIDEIEDIETIFESYIE